MKLRVVNRHADQEAKRISYTGELGFADDNRYCLPIAVNGDEDVAVPWTGTSHSWRVKARASDWERQSPGRLGERREWGALAFDVIRSLGRDK